MKKKVDPIFKEMLLNLWATFVYFFSQWLLIIAITRFKGYDNAGTFTLSVSFSNIFGYIGRFGIRGFQVGDVRFKYSDNQYISSRIITSAASILPFGIALAVCDYRPNLEAACLAMMCYKLLEGFDDVWAGSMQRRHRYDWIAISYTAKAMLPFAGFVLMMQMEAPLHLCIWSMVFLYLSILLFYDFPHLTKAAPFRWSIGGLRQLHLQCIPLMVMTILDAIIVYLPRNAVEKVLGAQELGYYGTISIIVVVFSTLAGSVWGSVLTRYSEIIQERRWRDFSKITAAVSLTLGAVALLAITVGNLVGPFFYQLLFGAEILSHMNLLFPVLLNAVLLLFNSFFPCILIPMGRRSVLMWTDAVSVAICVLIANPCTEYWETVGACISLTVSLFARFLLLLCCTVICVRREKQTSL